jgi:holo-[acyl-carrier protein] synthase
MERNGDCVSACTPRVGCDLAEVEAVRDSMGVFGERYLSRVYSAEERRQTGEAPERLAARFAGKEAVLKLLGVDGLSVRQVEIVGDAAGAPTVRLSSVAQASALAQGIGEIAVSLSHEAGMAMATAVALAVGPAGEH